jgi:hypothetical protein
MKGKFSSLAPMDDPDIFADISILEHQMLSVGWLDLGSTP